MNLGQCHTIFTVFVLVSICFGWSTSDILGPASSGRIDLNRLVPGARKQEYVNRISTGMTGNERNQMDDIIIQLLNGFKENMTSGFPDLGIPVLEPLKVEHIPLNISDPILTINGTIRNLKVIGLSGFNIVNVSSQFPKIAINLDLQFPKLEISGDYDVKGKAADVLPIYGAGPFQINLTDVDIKIGVRLKVKGGGKVSMEEINYEIKIQKIKVNIHGILGGGELGQTLNDMINAHALNMLAVFEPRIHDRVAAALLENINKMLEKIPITSILGGHSLPPPSPINNPVGLPTIWSKSGFQQLTRADASEYVDYALANLREYMIFNGLDKIPLENKTEQFSESFIGITWYGEASLYNGVLTGLEIIHRSGPANLNLENSDIVFDAELEVNDAGLKYSMLAQFMGLGPTATVIGSLESIKVFVKCRVPSGLNNVTLDEFKVLDLGHLSIDVHGLGPLGFIVGLIADLIGNSLKGVVADMLEGTIKSMLNEIIGNILFPLNANETTKSVSALHPYSRLYVPQTLHKVL